MNLKIGGADAQPTKKQRMDPEIANDVANKAIVENIITSFKLLRGFKIPEVSTNTIFINESDWREFIEVDGPELRITLLFIYVVNGGVHCLIIAKQGAVINVYDPNHTNGDFTFNKIKLKNLKLGKGTPQQDHILSILKAKGLISNTVNLTYETLMRYVSNIVGLIRGVVCEKEECHYNPPMGFSCSQPVTVDDEEAADEFMHHITKAREEAAAAAAPKDSPEIPVTNIFYLYVNGTYPKETEGICVSLSLVFFSVLRDNLHNPGTNIETLIDILRGWMIDKVTQEEFSQYAGIGLPFPTHLVEKMMSDMTWYMHLLATEPDAKPIDAKPGLRRHASAPAHMGGPAGGGRKKTKRKRKKTKRKKHRKKTHRKYKRKRNRR